MTGKQAIEWTWRLMMRLGSVGKLIDLDDIHRLRRLSRAILVINAEYVLKGELTKEREAVRDKLKASVTEIADRVGLLVHFQADPRGSAVWLLAPHEVKPGHTVAQCYADGLAVQ